MRSTEAEIAAELRHRPVGAVIADICHDLGIMPGHLTGECWDEIRHAIIAYGGSLVGFITKFNFHPSAAGGSAYPWKPPWPASPERSPAPATGPPWKMDHEAHALGPDHRSAQGHDSW
jgi:hypothetical protein